MPLLRIVTHLALSGAIAAGALSSACHRTKLPRPGRTSGDAHRTDETAVLATHPPPAALPEVVSERPSSRAQWLAGHWVWRGSSWIWQRGGWIDNPQRLRLVESQVRYTEDGALEFCPRRWLNAEGEEVDPPPIVTPAATPPTPQLREENTIP